MIDKDPNHLSRPVREGKSMGEFGTTDTTRTEGKQGWKVKKQIRMKKLKNPNHLSRPVREGKSMGEFGTTDTTRKEGKQGWKVRKQILTKKLKTLK